jgi:hypothetical protein
LPISIGSLNWLTDDFMVLSDEIYCRVLYTGIQSIAALPA